MDSITLSMVIIIFLSCLGLHFATVSPPLPPAPELVPATARKLPTLPVILVHPAVLRQNVAVARLMRSEGVIRTLA